jgi:hypothetical protein
VLLVKDSRVVETPVKTGSALGSRTEIMEGLAEGDKVVLRPEPDLTTGTRIKVESK